MSEGHSGFKDFGTKKYISPDNMRLQGTDIRFVILDIVRYIILDSRFALMEKRSNDALFAWGGMIETLDSFINSYYWGDAFYQAKRAKYMSEILNINPYDYSMKNKLKIKRTYDRWYSEIGIKLAKFKIYPPISVSYVQGVGEVL
jgi:hypothetical protein